MAVASLVAKVEGQVASFEKQFTNATKVAQKFEKDFANTASSVTAQQRRIEQSFSSFSGDKLAREATALAKAVDQVGGASRLTAAEQARVNATMTEAIAKYSALGQQAPKAMLDLAAATAKVEQPMTLASKAAGFLAGTFSQFTAANLAANALQSLAGGVAAFAAEGKRLPGLQASFNALTASVKQNSGEMLASLQRGTAGMVTDLNLMQAANKALLLGLPSTSQEMGELAATARILGKAMGQDATKSLDDLITALGRSSPLILDNLGLTVKVGEANDAYAAKLGKTADQLTEAEKKTAFFQAAMAKAREKTRELGDEVRTLGDRATQLSVAFGNRITGAVAGADQALGRATSSVANFGQFLQDAIGRGFGFAISMQQAAVAVENLQRAMKKDVNLPLPEETRKRLEEQAEALRKAKEAAEDHAKAVRALRDDISGAARADDLKVWADALRVPGLAAKTLADADLRRTLGSAIDVVTSKFGSLKAAGLGSLTGVGAAIKAMSQQAETIPPKIIDTMSAFTLLSMEGRSTDAVVKGLTFQMGQMITNGQVFKDKIGPKIFEGMRDSAERAARSTRNLGNIFEQILGGRVNQQGLSVGQQMKDVGLGAANNLVNGIADGIATGNWSGVGDAVQHGLSSAISVGIDALVPGLGTLLQPITDALLGKLRAAFGGPSKDELIGRDVVSSFEQTLQSTLSAAQKLSAGNEGWKLTTIAVRDAYVAAGRTAGEAEAAVKKLWESSKGGADKARLAVLEIQAVMDIAASKQKELGDEIAASTKDTDAATAALTDKIKGLSDQYNSLFKSIENEAPEEEMGVLERRTRDAMAAIEKEIKSVSKDGFGRMGDAADEAMRQIEEAFKNGTIKIPIEFVLPDGLRIPATGSSGGAAPALSFPSDPVTGGGSTAGGRGLRPSGGNDFSQIVRALGSIESRLVTQPKDISRAVKHAVAEIV